MNLPPGRGPILAVLRNAVLAVEVPHAVRVAIDGIDASGKTVLADDLARALEAAGRHCVRASIDDFRRPGHRDRSAMRRYTPDSYYETSYDYASVRDHLLGPLGAPGDHRVLIAKWDALNDRDAQRWVHAGDGSIVIVDGIFLQRPELRDSWDYRIWVDVDDATALERARARDIAWVGSDDEIVDLYTNRNFPAHRLYVAATGAPELAAARIDNTDPQNPLIVRINPAPTCSGDQ